jgi:hypothetical protein
MRKWEYYSVVEVFLLENNRHWWSRVYWFSPIKQVDKRRAPSAHY